MKTTFLMRLAFVCAVALALGPGASVAQQPSAELQPGPAIVTGENVNVRGRPTIRSEVITRLNRGETVVVLEKVTLPKPGPGEPAEWAKIAFPTNASVWVHAQFIDPTNKTVLPRRLNMRAGPGENYSVVGTLERGDAIIEVTTKDNWIQIVPPTNAYAYVAARYLRQEPTAAQLAAAKPEGELQPTPSPTPEPAPVVETVAPGPEIVATPAEPKVEPAPTTPPPTEPVVISPVPEEQLQPKRIVQREGIVRHSVSIQAPTLYCLVSPETGRIINYLYTTSTNLNLRRYKGLRVIVTGEEGLDPRWTNTPVLTIQRIYVVE